MTLPRVAYWNNVPAPYIVERFNAVARRGNLDFEAWFSARTAEDRTWRVNESRWAFPYRFLPSVGTDGRRLSVPSPLLGRERPDLLVSLYAGPSFLLGWAIARRRGVRTAFWTVVTFDRWVTRRRPKEALKRWIFSRVDGVITCGQDGHDFAMRYGTPEQRIFYAPHAIDVEHFASGQAAAYPERDRIRAELGLRGVSFIYVGRLWWGKGLDYLLDAFAVLQRRFEGEVSLLLLGDGPGEAHLRQRCRVEGLRNVVFPGFRQKPDLPRYYALADVFVFPTLGDPYGLVVDEAMACSLPVISTSAAGEIGDRIEDGVNGYVVPPENSAALLERMELLALDPDLRARMGETSAHKIAGHTPERWAEDFELAVERILSMPPRREIGTGGGVKRVGAMRILHVVPYGGWGGPHNCTLFLCKQAEAKGHESAVLLPWDADQAADRYSAAGVPVLRRHIGRLRRRLNPLPHLEYAARFVPDAWAVRQIVKAQRWDVVTINGLTNPQTALGARWGGASVVWNLPDTDAPRLLGALARRVAGPNAAFMAPARVVCDRYLRDSEHSAPGFVIPPPVGPHFFSEEAPEPAGLSGPPTVGIVSQLAPKKGPDIFLGAAKDLAGRYPALRFVVAGTSPPGFEWYEADLMREAAELTTRVQFLGPVVDVGRLLRSLRVLVFPSRPGLDGLPTVILEAMACGTPIVATRVAGVPEVLTDEHNGLLVPADDCDAMARAVARLLDNPDLAHRLAHSAWEYAQQNLQPDMVSAAYLRVYAGVVKGKA